MMGIFHLYLAVRQAEVGQNWSWALLFKTDDVISKLI